MPEIGPQHPLTYRQEIAAPIFDLIRANESCAIVGPASMGKSRLLQFLLRNDVQQHYLGDAAANTWLIVVDCNRLAEQSEWGFYELLLTSLTESARDLDHDLRQWFNELRREAITNGNALLAQRHLELAFRVLRQEHGIILCFILDEFDAIYRALPPSALANLRALRDADRYSLCYVLLLREHPARLRAPDDNEGFYELLSRSVIGLKPYTEADARRVIAQLATRRRRAITEAQTGEMLRLSGGHPGLIVALFDLLSNGKEAQAGEDLVEWALAQPQVAEECRKLWAGLGMEAQLGLSHLAQGIPVTYVTRELLALKGLIQLLDRGEAVFFSPLLQAYVLTQGAPNKQGLWLDETAAVVWVEGRPVNDLTNLEFELIRYLHRRKGQLCPREQIAAALYPREKPDAADIPGNRLDSLVRRLRKKIESESGGAAYLVTVRGQGYKLIDGL